MKSRSSQLKYSFSIFLIFLLPGLFHLSALNLYAQCTSVDYQKSFQRVYRQHKMYLEGLADLTGDGKPDAFGYRLTNLNFKDLVVLPNNGSGGFGDPIVSNTDFNISKTSAIVEGRFYGSVVTGKINADNSLDLAVQADTSPAAVFSLQNNGSGSFSVLNSTLLSANEKAYQIADFNNDGRGDLLTVTAYPSFTWTDAIIRGFSYRLGNADGTFGAAVSLYDSVNSATPVIGDFNNDGKVDIAYTYYNGSSNGGDNRFYFRLLTNLGNGIFSPGSPILPDSRITGAADLNNDGKLDLFGYDILINNGNGNFTKSSYPSNPVEPFPPGTSYYTNLFYSLDYDGDGDTDILLNREGRIGIVGFGRRFYSVYLNNGSGIFTKTVYTKHYNGIPADFNGDGKAENVNFVNSTLSGSFPSATNETVVIVSQPTCQPVQSGGQTKLIDFNGDAVSDMATWQNNGVWAFLSNNMESTFNWGTSGDSPAPGDFDGDGKTDAAVYRNGTGVWYIQRSSDGGLYALAFGLPGDIPVPADYDGDGKSDIAVFRPSTGDWHLWLMGPQQYRGIRWGISEDRPLPADYDGDGKMDVAVFRPSTGFWYYLRSSDNGFGWLNWGISSDIQIPADFDSDGKADITVFRNGVWYIYRSSDNALHTVALGQDGDIPMAVDSNGDGVLELGLYRPAGTSWYTSGQKYTLWSAFGTNSAGPLRLMLRNN